MWWAMLRKPKARPRRFEANETQAVAGGLYDGNPCGTDGAFPYDYNNNGLRDVVIGPHPARGTPPATR